MVEKRRFSAYDYPRRADDIARLTIKCNATSDSQNVRPFDGSSAVDSTSRDIQFLVRSRGDRTQKCDQRSIFGSPRPRRFSMALPWYRVHCDVGYFFLWSKTRASFCTIRTETFEPLFEPLTCVIRMCLTKLQELSQTCLRVWPIRAALICHKLHVLDFS